METFVRLAVLAALCLAAPSAQGRELRASHLSNQRDVEDLCPANAPETSCADAEHGAEGGGLAPHPADCRLFVQCVSAAAAPVCRTCPAGLHFNPALHVCDKPERAGCINATEAPSVPGAEAGAADDIPARCVANSVTHVSCRDAHSPDALLPHPDDCGLFYYCVSAAAAPVCRACSAGLHFSPALHVCDDPAQAGCRTPELEPEPEPGPSSSY